MGIVFDIMHLAVAAVLAMIGVGYEREQDCPPVHFSPAAEIVTVEPASAESAFVEISGCDGGESAVRFPAL